MTYVSAINYFGSRYSDQALAQISEFLTACSIRVCNLVSGEANDIIMAGWSCARRFHFVHVDSRRHRQELSARL